MISLLLSASVALSASAADAEMEQCLDAVSSASDRALGHCAEQRTRRADEWLNEKWNELMRMVGRDSPMGQSLITEERAWIAYKETACAYLLTEPTGTMERYLLYPSCQQSVIEARVAQIESIIEYTQANSPE